MTLICYLYILPLTLTTVSITLPTPTDAVNSLSLHRASSIYGQFNKTYRLNISRTASVSIVYNQLRHQVTMHVGLVVWLILDAGLSFNVRDCMMLGAVMDLCIFK